MTSSKKPDEIEELDTKDQAAKAEDSSEIADAEVIEDSEVPEAVDEGETSNDTLENASDDQPTDNADSDETPDDSTEASEQHAEPAAAVAPPPVEKSGGGFLPTLLGGVLAAGIGFAVSQFMFTGSDSASDQAELQTALDQQSRDIASLQQAVEALASAPAPVIPDMTGALDELKSELSNVNSGVSTGLTDLTAQLDAIEARLTTVEKRPVASTDTSGAVESYERELAAIRKELAEQQTMNDEMSEQVGAAAAAAKAEIDAASARARAIETQAAVQAVQSALDTGTSYLASLAALPGEVPAGLSASADTGVATLPELQSTFDEYARKALSAALKEAPGASTQDRIESFLRSQLNIRSLSPRDGDDPDAVLSRAQGALAANDLATALTELDLLPDSGKAAMSGWTDQAKARLAALEAIETLAKSLNQN